jgi:hypothetical protein
MEKSNQKTFETKRVSRELGGRWRLWEGFVPQANKRGNYYDNMRMIYPIETLNDLFYLLTQTSYAKPSNFFFDIDKNCSKKYQANGYILEEDNESYNMVKLDESKI